MQIAKDASASDREERIDQLLGVLSLDEKVDMLSGHGFMKQIAADKGRYCASLYHIGAGNDRLGIPPLLFNDGPRGVAKGASTCFPVSMARGAAFDVDLERRVGDAIGREMRAHGANLFGGVCINLLRHPAWGRAQETYGEDPFHLGEMGAALTEGVQHHRVVATIKHFAANSMENARFRVDVSLAERPLREVYLRHFERCVRAGARGVMSAYNQLNGAYCGHNPDLLTRILKEEWGFDGFVYSDFVLGCRAPDACEAGLDVEAPDTIHFGDKLRKAIEEGAVSEERVDDAVRRVLRVLFWTLAESEGERESYSPEQIAGPAHVSLAREVAEKSIVLLKNEDALPWTAEQRRILLLGRLADTPNLGDNGSSRVYPPEVVTPLAGLRAGCPDGVSIEWDPGTDLERVRSLAAAADAVLVVAGYDHHGEGEFIPGEMIDLSGDKNASIGGDRLDLTLGREQEALILAAAGSNTNTTVALMAGSAVLVERWRNAVSGILMLWYPGMQGGHALADVLFGRVNPSGHLPFSVPRDESDLPFFDREADAIEYDLWHGYTKLERDGTPPAFPFGFGLSYTSFAFESPALELDLAAERLDVSVDVRNTGERDGDAVAQVYAGCARPADDQPRKRLCGFRRVSVAAGTRERVTISVALRDLAYFDVEQRVWRLGAPEWRIYMGGSSDEKELRSCTIDLPEHTWPVTPSREPGRLGLDDGGDAQRVPSKVLNTSAR